MKVAWSACARKMRLGERCSGCSGCGGRGRRRVAPVAAELIVIRRRLARCTPSRTERNLAIQYNTVIITIIFLNPRKNEGGKKIKKSRKILLLLLLLLLLLKMKRLE